MLRKIISLILVLIICMGLAACGGSDAKESSVQESDKPAENQYAGKYSGIGLYVDEKYLLDDYFNSWVTVLNDDGTGSIDWDEVKGAISGWSVENGALTIKAGVSDIKGSIKDGVMLYELDGGYVVASVIDGYDISKLDTMPLDDFMSQDTAIDYSGTYYPFAIGNNGYCVAYTESESENDGVFVLNKDGTATCVTGGIENRFTWVSDGNAITLTDDFGNTMDGTIENGILILNVPTPMADGTTQIMQGYYAQEGADCSSITVLTPEEYMAAVSAEASASGTSVTADPAVAELEENYIGLSEDTLTWDYNESTKTITVSGQGAMKDYMETEPDWYKYCESAEHIIIGDEVTSVSPGAFGWFTLISDVSFGASVEFIGDFAFCACYELRSINFPAGLKYVGEGAFNNALLHSDNGFILPEGLLYLGDGSFYSAFKESYVSVPASLTYIGENSFANCFLNEFTVSSDNPAYLSENGILYDKNMKTLINYPAGKTDTVYEVPGSVTDILDEAIEVTNTLEKIIIPSSVSYIDEQAIYWNYALTSIEVDENNSCYKSVDGVLFTKDGKTLLSYPIADTRSEYTIPDGCERIGMNSISQANNLTVISMPEGLREIGLLAFWNCKSLSSVYLPKSLAKIEDQAFLYCDALSEIHYAGSSADWQKIEIGNENELLSNGQVSIICAE